MKALGYAAAAAVLFTGAAHAQSSKFAAAYDKDGIVLGFAYECVDSELCSDGAFNTGLGYAAHMGTIKSPQGKELLIGLSAVPGLVTFTEAKGKNKAGASESVAVAGVGMAVAYAPVNSLGAGYSAADVCETGAVAEPGPVPLSVRVQYLSVDVDLDVLDTELENCDGDPASDPDCLSDTLLIDGDVTVALGLATAAAHHFNFLAPDLPQSGDYAVAACFVGGALAGVSGSGSALGIAALGKRMMTVQNVRAVKDAVFEVD